jgi:hypothetical protein
MLSLRSCGKFFNVWEKVEEDGKGPLHDFTSLMGSDKHLLLKVLPSKLSAILPLKQVGQLSNYGRY